MARMFCTVKQAAGKLDMTEAQIENMLDEGTLPEFREGSRRLVKMADLVALDAAAHRSARTRRPHGGKKAPRCPSARKAESSGPRVRGPAASGITLPRRVTASATVNHSLPQPRKLHTHEMSAGQWIWMGLLDDEPVAILLLAAAILLAVGTVGGAIYLLVQAL